MTEPLVIVKHLKKYYPVKAGLLQRTVSWIKAVDDISFSIQQGETLGLVGESGCGKTTAGKAMINLVRPTSGEVLFNTSQNCSRAEYINIAGLPKRDRRRTRKMVQIIFQNPYSSLNPRMTVFRMMKEVIACHDLAPAGRPVADIIRELMATVGLQPTDAHKYPHEFSGGQRQRIGIARALLINPKLIVCDEPVSALDVSIQAQIINLLAGLKLDLGLTYLFIAHDLAVVKHISDRIAVMYLGKIMEIAPRREFYTNPLHPYTEALLSAAPAPTPDRARKRLLLTGDVPSPMNVPPGCRFHTRCPLAQDVCRKTEPELTDRNGDHKVACHFR
jgi:oligopeptide/dipeptide ABC transporter ATP-binding protein